MSENENLHEELKPVEIKKGWWTGKDKKEKRGFFFTILFIIILAAAVFGFAYCRPIFGNEIGDVVLGVGVPNGWVAMGAFFTANAITLMISLLIVLVTVVVFMVLKAVIKSVSKKNQRSRTVGSLLISVFRYTFVIVDFAIILTLWGVNIASAVAGVSILAILIGFGCKNLVADIVSGLFIVFDDYFAVGDAVIIDGFRGKVTEIGLRTVKIDDSLGNIKCIANSNIQTCVNLSRTINTVTASMEIGYNEDIDRVEAILAIELPKVLERCPKMLEAPVYRGIDSFTNSGVELSFAVKCRYDDRWSTNRDLRRELYRIFTENDIYFTFQQVVVNSPDPTDRPKATAEEYRIAQEVLKRKRAAGPYVEKDNFFDISIDLDNPIQINHRKKTKKKSSSKPKNKEAK